MDRDLINEVFAQKGKDLMETDFQLKEMNFDNFSQPFPDQENMNSLENPFNNQIKEDVWDKQDYYDYEKMEEIIPNSDYHQGKLFFK